MSQAIIVICINITNFFFFFLIIFFQTGKVFVIQKVEGIITKDLCD